MHILDGQEVKKSHYRVPFGTVSITPRARRLIDDALDRGWVTKGPYVRELEERFAALFGTAHAVAVSSGTDADALACAALTDRGARRGDEVIVPALSFIASGNAVLQAGLRPVFVDVRRDSLTLDTDRLEAAVTDRTRAIMAVHLMGKPADMDAIDAVARRHGLTVIEDAAEAHGAEYRGRKVGTLGDMACFSLYAAHIVTTIEGGMILTDDPDLADTLRSLRNHGIVGKFTAQRIGFSAKMNELEAAVGLGNIEIFDEILARRRRNVALLIERFAPFSDRLLCLREEPHERLGPHAFSIIVREEAGFSRQALVEHLERSGIDSRPLFCSIPTQCPAYAFLGHRLGDFPEAEFCGRQGFHIGIHQDLEPEDLEFVADRVAEFLDRPR